MSARETVLYEYVKPQILDLGSTPAAHGGLNDCPPGSLATGPDDDCVSGGTATRQCGSGNYPSFGLCSNGSNDN